MKPITNHFTWKTYKMCLLPYFMLNLTELHENTNNNKFNGLVMRLSIASPTTPIRVQIGNSNNIRHRYCPPCAGYWHAII